MTPPRGSCRRSAATSSVWRRSAISASSSSSRAALYAALSLGKRIVWIEVVVMLSPWPSLIFNLLVEYQLPSTSRSRLSLVLRAALALHRPCLLSLPDARARSRRASPSRRRHDAIPPPLLPIKANEPE